MPVKSNPLIKCDNIWPSFQRPPLWLITIALPLVHSGFDLEVNGKLRKKIKLYVFRIEFRS